jgi:hypothetical protein
MEVMVLQSQVGKRKDDFLEELLGNETVRKGLNGMSVRNICLEEARDAINVSVIRRHR